MPTELFKPVNLDKPDDSLIWAAFKNDDREAFELIYQSNVRHLYNYGMKIFHDSELVEDGIQELFIDLWDQRKNLSNTNNIQFYLFKALRWKIIKNLEQLKKQRASLKESKSYLPEEVTLPHEDLLINETITSENRKKIKKALKKLPGRQREVIHLLFYQKYSYDEISQIMSLNLRSVYALAWKALSNLKRSILVILVSILTNF